jgi:hypothetical protein
MDAGLVVVRLGRRMLSLGLSIRRTLRVCTMSAERRRSALHRVHVKRGFFITSGGYE